MKFWGDEITCRVRQVDGGYEYWCRWSYYRFFIRKRQLTSFGECRTELEATREALLFTDNVLLQINAREAGLPPDRSRL